MMSSERALDIIRRFADYKGDVLYADQLKPGESVPEVDQTEYKIVDICEIGTDSAVVLWKKKPVKALHWLSMYTLILDGRNQFTESAREYIKNANVHTEGGDARMGQPSSASAYASYLMAVGAMYRHFDKEFASNKIDRYNNYDLCDFIEDFEGYRPNKIYSTCVIGGTGLIAVQYPVKKEDYEYNKPTVNFAIIDNGKVIIKHTLPTRDHNISYGTLDGKTKKMHTASNYAEMWLSYGVVNKDSMNAYINEAIKKAYESPTEEDNNEAEEE